MLDAVWDPVAGKVVYKEAAVVDENQLNKERQVSSMILPKQPPTENLEWRSSNNEKYFDRRPRSLGVDPSHFHQSAKPGQEIVQKLLGDSQKRAIQQQTACARQQQDHQRQAFKLLTVYQTFPLQERALLFWQQLRREWGVLTETEDTETNNNTRDDWQQDERVMAESSSSSSGGNSATTAASLDVPEAKRCLRDRELSPTQCQDMQQFRTEFLQQRALPLKIVKAALGPALWSMEPRVFGVESGTRGRRRYVVAHAGRFFDMYWRKTEAPSRHAYELIRPRTPCRLYLDLECSKIDNPLLGRSPALQEQLLTELLQELSIELQEQYGAHNSNNLHWTNANGKRQSYRLEHLQRHHVVDLDSSTDTKFSRHWIVHVPISVTTKTDNDNDDADENRLREALFEDAAAVGSFVRQWVGRLAEQQATGRLLHPDHLRPVLSKHLFVQKAISSSKKSPGTVHDNTASLIDMGVYTRNRLFRLMGSSKFGKPTTAALRIAVSNEFPFPESFGNDCFYPPEMTPQLIPRGTVSAASVGLLTEAAKRDVDFEVLQSLAKTDWTMHAEALAQTFIVPLNSAKLDFPILPLTAAETDNVAASFNSAKSRHRPKTMYASHIGRSPYPMLDDFVMEHLANRGEDAPAGSIRAWSIETDSFASHRPVKMTYQISRNRWCECVGRSHKSNNIAWHVDLQLHHCYQTCFDPDCRALNFRGQPVPLPTPVQDALQEAFFEEELARLDIAAVQVGATGQLSNQSQTVNDVDEADAFLSDDDDSFEKALAALNLDDLTQNARSGVDESASSSQTSLSCQEAKQFIPESSADRWLKLFGDDDFTNEVVISSDGSRSNSRRCNVDDQYLMISKPVAAQPVTRVSSSKCIAVPVQLEIQDADDEQSSTDSKAVRLPVALPSGKGLTEGQTSDDDNDSSDDDDLVALARKLEQRRNERKASQEKSRL